MVAVKERENLTLDDRRLLARAGEEGRALVTEDISDFVLLARELATSNRDHAGIVFVHPRRFTRSRAGIGALVSALASLLDALGDDDTLDNQQRWLLPLPPS